MSRCVIARFRKAAADWELRSHMQCCTREKRGGGQPNSLQRVLAQARGHASEVVFEVQADDGPQLR